MHAIRKIYQFFTDKPIKCGVILKDRYEVLHSIGAGSYGLVYLCKDLAENEKRVIKQLRPSKNSKRKEIEMFEHEISLMLQLNHRNIPTIFETFTDNGSLFYVMSYIEGDNLEDLIFLKKKVFNEEESLQVVFHLLEFVNYLHQKDIFHQDVRIPNILERNGEYYLIDLGLAQSPKNERERQEMKLQDYYDLGDILLYLLYTTYTSTNKKALPWTEELSLKKETVILLKRLLHIDEPYLEIRQISNDLQKALYAQKEGD